MIPARRAGPRAAATLLVVATLAHGAAALAQAPLPSPAAGAPAEELARGRFEEGTRAFDGGDFVAAARLFLEAYALSPHHAALWNAARAQRRAGELASAANLYRRYLREAPDGSVDRDAAIADLATLTPLLGRLQIVAPGAVALSVDGALVDDSLVWVNPGAHVVAGRIGPSAVTATAEVAAGGVVSVALLPAPQAAPRTAPALAPAQPPAPFVSPARRDGGEAARGGGWPAWAILPFAGATAVAGGAMIASGVDTENLHDEFEATGETSGYAYDNGFFAMHRTNVLVAITAGLGAVTAGIGLFAIDWNGDAPGGRVVGSPTPGGLVARAEL